MVSGLPGTFFFSLCVACVCVLTLFSRASKEKHPELTVSVAGCLSASHGHHPDPLQLGFSKCGLTFCVLL